MPFIPNEPDAFHISQSAPDSGDFDVLRDGSKATGVVQGCAVTAQGSPDMTCAVAAGVIAVAGAKANVAAGNVTITTADGTDPRIDLVVVSSAGVKSVVAGDPAPEMVPGSEPGPSYPAIPANSVVLAAVYVPANDTTIASNQITDKRVFVVPPEATTNYDLAKALAIPRVKERSQTVTLDTGQFQIHGSALANGRLYFTTRTAPAYFIRCNNLDDLTDRSSFQFANDGNHDNADSCVYVAETNRLYVGFYSAGKIAEVHPDTLATTDVITVSGSPAAVILCSDGTNLYVATAETPDSRVLKYRLSDFTLQGTATLTGRPNAHAILYDGVELFVTGPGTPAWVARVNPSDMTFTDASFPTGISSLTDDLASVGDYLFTARETGTVQNLYRVNKATLAQEVIPTHPNTIYGLFFDGRWLWVGYNTAPGTVARVDPQSGESVVHTFASGEDSPNEILSDGHRFFVTFWSPNPGKIKRLVNPAGVPAPGRSVKTLSLQHTAVDTDTGSEKTLLSYTVPGSTLRADGAAFKVKVSGSFAANDNAKRILLKFGTSPVTVFDTGSLLFNDVRWELEALCVRTSEDNQKWVTRWTSDSALLASKVHPTTTTKDDAVIQSLLVRGQGVADNDVVNETLEIEAVN